MVTSDFRPEVEIWPFCACAMHPAGHIGTVRSLWNWLWGIPRSTERISSYYYFTPGSIGPEVENKEKDYKQMWNG